MDVKIFYCYIVIHYNIFEPFSHVIPRVSFNCNQNATLWNVLQTSCLVQWNVPVHKTNNSNSITFHLHRTVTSWSLFVFIFSTLTQANDRIHKKNYHWKSSEHPSKTKCFISFLYLSFPYNSYGKQCLFIAWHIRAQWKQHSSVYWLEPSACGFVRGVHARTRQQDTTIVPLSTFALKSTRTHLDLLNLISAVLFELRCALKCWASWLLPVPPIHNKGRPDEDRGCQSPISVPFIMADLEALTAPNYWLRTISTNHQAWLST